jgi:VIT1/CCC1 family predicted Fe2+/Mn2+ transporter
MFKVLSKYSMGATAAIITSMGLIAGLTQSDAMRQTTIAGLLIIAVADNISDSLGIHVYKESEGAKNREILSATFGNFFLRLVLVLSFILIVLLFSSLSALLVSSVWGLTLLVLLSYSIANVKKTTVHAEIIWHVVVALLVIVGSRLIGSFIIGHI